ncbi:cupin domain-containing protein [Dendronalium phyllosphericum]|uniref:cupin domain-containing protein n=1 Tax=Dendronalium phyllosphericum TaxID=2840445 RepID=UPI001CEDF078|nr:cupin domain-containing protein [Dendronalium phyllosphericum]
MGVFKRVIWQKEVCKFPRTQEIHYFLVNNAIATPNGGQPVQMGKGYLMTFAAGMSDT